MKWHGKVRSGEIGLDKVRYDNAIRNKIKREKKGYDSWHGVA